MLKNYFVVAFRNLFRQKGYSLLNLVGLSLGIASCLLLTLHVKDELGYEKAFPKHEFIYRFATTEWSKSHPAEAAELMKFFPGIKSAVRLVDAGRPVVNSESGNKWECKGFFSDSTMIDIFDMKRVVGDPVHALGEPFSVVITRSMSERLFGKKDPLGQRLTFADRDAFYVRGVIEDLPVNTHLKFDFLISMATLAKFTPPDMLNNRHWMFGWTYLLFNTKGDAAAASKRLGDFWMHYWAEEPDKAAVASEAAKIRLQPLTDIHLRSDLIQEMGPNGNIIYVYIFVVIGVLILLIACINFINLFTTQALKRLKEVAIRKILGAQKWELVLQFLGEAFILTILAGFAATLLYEIALPFYNGITGKQTLPGEILRPVNVLVIAGIVVFTGLLSGLFPALFITGFEPADSLKGNKIPRSPANLLRKSLVVFQFVAASFLIIATVIVYQQMNLFRNKQLGFDKDQVLVVNLYGNLKDRLIAHPEVVSNELLSNPDILAVGNTSNLIGEELSVEAVTPVNPDPSKNYPTVRVLRVDENYLTVLGIKLKEGRNFSKVFNDSASFIINERAAAVLELKNPVGAPLVNSTFGGLKGKVVGVVRDFHFASLHSQVEPLVLQYNPGAAGSMLIKIKAGKSEPTIAYMKSRIEKISPGALFSYGFLDDKIAGLYRKEDTMGAILKALSILSIVISCLGLFGLTAHATEVRAREIGIRKVIGATVPNLVRLLSRDFLLLVAAGNLIAWPFAWWAVHQWLQEFVYRVGIGWEVFLFSGVISLAIAVLTVAFHCIKTASVNPVRSLKAE